MTNNDSHPAGIPSFASLEELEDYDAASADAEAELQGEQDYLRHLEDRAAGVR